MATPDLLEGIWLSTSDNFGLPFDGSCRVRRRGDCLTIYNPAEDQRYQIAVTLAQKDLISHGRVGLYQLLPGSTWHQLIEVERAVPMFYPGTETTIRLDVTRPLDYLGSPGLAHLQAAYSTGNLCRRQIEQIGFYETSRTKVEDSLRSANVLALTPDDLPEEIDVLATARTFIDGFWEGNFEPGQFILPAPEIVQHIPARPDWERWLSFRTSKF